MKYSFCNPFNIEIIYEQEDYLLYKQDIPACSICKEVRCNAFPELHIFLNFVPFAFNFIFKVGLFILSTSLNDSWGYGCNTLNI